MSNTNQGLTLFDAAGILDPIIEQVFGAKDIANKDGRVVGRAVKLNKPDAVRVALGFTKTKEGREAAAIEIRKAQDMAFARFKSMLVNAPQNLTLAAFAQRTNAKGVKSTTVKLEEKERPDSPEALKAKLEAMGYVVEMEKATPPVNVTATVVEPEALPEPQPEPQPEPEAQPEPEVQTEPEQP